MRQLCCLLFVLCTCCCYAQQTGSVTIKAGSRPSEVLSNTDIYHYPQFVQGQVYLKDGTVATARINYNRLLDEMQFIDPKGDTMSMASEQTIRYVALGTDSFYFAGGFVRRLSGGNTARLAIKQFWKVADNRKQGGYNTTSSLAASVPKGFFTSGNRVQRLNIGEDLVLERAELYYFGNRNNRFLAAGKKNLLSLFPKSEKQITAFLNDHKIDFRKKEDLEKVLIFLEQLQGYE